MVMIHVDDQMTAPDDSYKASHKILFAVTQMVQRQSLKGAASCLISRSTQRVRGYGSLCRPVCSLPTNYWPLSSRLRNGRLMINASETWGRQNLIHSALIVHFTRQKLACKRKQLVRETLQTSWMFDHLSLWGETTPTHHCICSFTSRLKCTQNSKSCFMQQYCINIRH